MHDKLAPNDILLLLQNERVEAVSRKDGLCSVIRKSREFDTMVVMQRKNWKSYRYFHPSTLVSVYKLIKPATDRDILKKLGNSYVVNPFLMFAFLSMHEENPEHFIFFSCDYCGNLRNVSVFWSSIENGWDIGVSKLQRYLPWPAGHRVVIFNQHL